MTATHPDADRSSRVLLVDDDADVLRTYERILRSLGCSVETARDGSEAIERMSGPPFNLVLCDINMPRTSGVAFLQSVRALDLDVPVVLMTGQPELDTAVQAVEYGAFRYLAKPISLEEMDNVVLKATQMHRLALLKREALELIGNEGKQLGDRASLDARFSRALEQVWIAYQPIVQPTERAVYAYEALLRSDEPSLRSPPDLLDAAERLGRLHDLGRCVRERIARSSSDAPEGTLLFVNLHAVDLNDDELFSPTSPLSKIAPRVVLEITERASLHGVARLTGKVATLRELGFRIAVDDLGAGYAGLSSFSQLEPEFVKLDMSLVRDVDTSTRKRRVVGAMAHLCVNELGVSVVAEGVETVAERDALTAEGCALQQGYHFARPARGFPDVSW